MTFERSQRPSSTTAAAVSSHDVSMPRMSVLVVGGWSLVGSGSPGHRRLHGSSGNCCCRSRAEWITRTIRTTSLSIL